MTEAPDVYPDSPDEGDASAADEGVEGLAEVGSGAQPGADALRTGDQHVDEVLASLSELDERPVSEHAAVFERAHDQLRAALDPDHRSARA